MSQKKQYFTELIAIVIGYFICFGFGFIIMKSIPGYSIEAYGKRLVSVVGYMFCNVIVFIGVSLLQLPTKNKLIAAGIVVLVEAAISGLIYWLVVVPCE